MSEQMVDDYEMGVARIVWQVRGADEFGEFNSENTEYTSRTIAVRALKLRRGTFSGRPDTCRFFLLKITRTRKPGKVKTK